MDLGRTGIAHHLDDLHAGCAANDRIVDQDNAFALDQRPVGVVFQLDAEMAHLVARLDEGPSDIMRADDAEFEGYARFLGIADRRGHPAVGHRDDEIGVNAVFTRQLGTDSLAHRIDRRSVDDRIGS